MAKRMNRHIGRKMKYPYDGAPPKRQVAYVFDTNKCIACQTCTIACKTCWTSGKGQEQNFWNNVESRPYGGYPQGWDLKLMEQMGTARWHKGRLRSQTIFESHGAKDGPTGYRPTAGDYAAPNLGEDDVAGDPVQQGGHFMGTHPMWMFYLARICNHCDSPACLAACPKKAIYKRDEDGIVLVDQQRCRGYQECVRACPYKKTFFNAVARASEKCIGCFPRVEKGEVALCVESCTGKIRLQGFLSTDGEPKENNPLDYLVYIRKIALPLYPQFGTGPNVYYIPPLHIPDGFNDQMFGPGVQEAQTLYKNLKDDKKLLGALMLSGASQRIVTTFEVRGDNVLGWDEAGTEVANVPLTEATWVRDHYDEKHKVYRHNTT